MNTTLLKEKIFMNFKLISAGIVAGVAVIGIIKRKSISKKVREQQAKVFDNLMKA